MPKKAGLQPTWNIFASGLNEPVGGRSALGAASLLENGDEEASGHLGEVVERPRVAGEARVKRMTKKVARGGKPERQRKKRRERANDFYFLSFDNELSDSSLGSASSDSEAARSVDGDGRDG
jgi:hypothetical protein